jgi:maleate isomerase
MPFTSWRGIVGLIKPARRPGSLEELIRLLPQGIGVIPLFANVREGSRAEFKVLLAEYEAKVAELVADGVDFVHLEGAPPFMLLGYAAERELLRAWEASAAIPIFTSGTNHIAALHALGVKRFVGVTYIPGDPNQAFAQYFRDAGFEVLDMVGMDIAFDKVNELSAHEVYRFIRKVFLANPGAEAIYMMGPGWIRSIDIIDMMERDFGVPVLHTIPAECWEIQKRLHVRQRIPGYGRLLAEMP